MRSRSIKNMQGVVGPEKGFILFNFLSPRNSQRYNSGKLRHMILSTDLDHQAHYCLDLGCPDLLAGWPRDLSDTVWGQKNDLYFKFE